MDLESCDVESEEKVVRLVLHYMGASNYTI